MREREAQTVSCVGMIMWCTGAEDALQSDKNRVEQMKVFYQQNVRACQMETKDLSAEYVFFNFVDIH